MNKVSVAIVGAGGYTGQELVRLVLGHPRLRLVGVFGSDSSAGQPLGEIAPAFRNLTELVVEQASAESIAASGATHVFLATPHEYSMRHAPELLERGLTVLDLSGAFRLCDKDLYPKHYGFAHESSSTLASALYTIPELCRGAIPNARLISLAGCYATSVILPMAPHVRAGMLKEGEPIIVDATSGVSGAGRSPSVRTSFCEVSQSPYGVMTHRHEPEMIEHAGVDVIFTPHLGPYDRGILSTMHLHPKQGITRDDLLGVWTDAFSDSHFVRILPEGTWPSVSAVRHTNMIDLALEFDETRGRVIVFSALDNLLKGASGQALQALNIHLGFDECLGFGVGNAPSEVCV